MKIKKAGKRNISIRLGIIISFIMLMMVTVSVIGYIVFSNWLSSADKAITKIAEDMDNEIFNRVDAFMNVPLHINEVNCRFIEERIVNVGNEIERDRFFVGVLKFHDEDLYSFSYGTEKGEYYGARRNKNNIIEIMKNNADTGGHSWYYSVANGMTAGELVVQAGKFDPRKRDWYKAAKEAQKPVFSQVYKHFIIEDLAVSASLPIYNDAGVLQGVLGSHIILSKIDSYLEEIAGAKKALAIIVEKDSGELIANSFDIENYKILEDGTVKRVTIDQIDNLAIIQAYEKYKAMEDDHFRIKSGKDKLYINLTEYKKDGLDWLVITAIPGSLFIADIMNNVKLTLILIAFALLLSIAIYLMLINRFLGPVNNLIIATEKLSQGDLSQRVEIVRDDEIGRISKAFNKMADTIYMLVNNLETKVKERTIELEKANNLLKENKERLQLILDSTAEAIYGVDVHGNCTFCNASGLKLLGYKDQSEIIGRNMHFQIHHSLKDGTPVPIEECNIFNALKSKKDIQSEDGVFWRSDGTSFDVAYNSYIQYKEGQVVGAVITFIDNTERKKNEEYIKYLSYHDSLTGIYNRISFERELKRLDIKENLPISIIFGDVNGLKLTNDVFGHSAGDELLKRTAKILRTICREEDIVARVGGDEFAIILPKTKEKDAKGIIARIKNRLSKEQIVAIKCSMSMGYATKTEEEQSIEKIIEKAEDEMYREKVLDRKGINSYIISTIMETLCSKSGRAKLHSLIVSELCEKISRAMGMPEMEVRRHRDAGRLHDIGKIVLNEAVINKDGELTEDEKKEMQQHPITGYRILNLCDDTLDLADGILNHHERWDGTGYPKGLKGEEIPKMSRIIAIAEAYDYMTNRTNKNAINNKEALNEIKKQSGKKFDPEIVDAFIDLMSES